ncbi:hypothetical protein [Vibrio taketomensis]|uniref:hypothetical protein n=1 Tax=Vibrio taketomensis TaxID=2572923 RepID=UPI00138A02DB|nr:hypothetical protein [Vibrio taketomensis]
MTKILFDLLITKGFENMFGVTKKQWMLVAVTVVVMLGVMYALANVDALSPVGEKVGLNN